MCMLTVFPMPDLMDGPTAKRLLNGADCNPHGSGWAVISNGRILTGKSMDDEQAVDTFQEAYRSATGPAIFHSRWATHGDKSIANVHPFPVPWRGSSPHILKAPDTYIAHNGIMPQESCPSAKDLRSDTRVFADDILPIRFKRLDNPNVRKALGQWLGGNKIAVLTTSPRLRRNLYVFGLDLGEWVDGVWYSNGDHEGWSKYRHSYNGEECFWCKTKTVSSWAICQTCGTCQDCFEPSDTCECYISPSTTTRPDEEPDPTSDVQFSKAVILGPSKNKPLALEGAKDWKADAEAGLGYPKLNMCKVGYDSATGTERAYATVDAELVTEGA